MADRETAIAALAMSHGGNLEQRVRERFSGESEDDIRDIIRKVEAKRGELW